MTMYDTRTALAQQVVAEVEKYFAGKVFKTRIPRNVRLSEAPSHGQPIYTYAPSSPGGKAYRELANEVAAQDGFGGQPADQQAPQQLATSDAGAEPIPPQPQTAAPEGAPASEQ